MVEQVLAAIPDGSRAAEETEPGPQQPPGAGQVRAGRPGPVHREGVQGSHVVEIDGRVEPDRLPRTEGIAESRGVGRKIKKEYRGEPSMERDLDIVSL